MSLRVVTLWRDYIEKHLPTRNFLVFDSSAELVEVRQICDLTL